MIGASLRNNVIPIVTNDQYLKKWIDIHVGNITHNNMDTGDHISNEFIEVSPEKFRVNDIVKMIEGKFDPYIIDKLYEIK